MSEWRLYFYRMLAFFMPEMRGFGIRRSLLNWCGAKIGTGVRVCASARILGEGGLVIGDNVWISPEALIRASPNSTLSIGANTRIGPRVILWTGSHKIIAGGSVAASDGISMDISVGAGCWLCAGSIVCPGVALGDCVVLAAGSVATHSVDGAAHVIIAGVPAEMKRRI